MNSSKESVFMTRQLYFAHLACLCKFLTALTACKGQTDSTLEHEELSHVDVKRFCISFIPS